MARSGVRSSPLAEPVEDDEDDDTVKPLPDRLVTELTAHRTLALRNALANDPAVAFQAVVCTGNLIRVDDVKKSHKLAE